MTQTDPLIGTIMLIDDNKIDQMLYQRIISRSGLVNKITSFLLATDALDYLLSDGAVQPDLILLDINMPRMNGFEFLEAVQTHFGQDFAPVVVMLTTSLDPKDEARVKQIGLVRDYLIKPLTEAQLETLIALVTR